MIGKSPICRLCSWGFHICLYVCRRVPFLSMYPVIAYQWHLIHLRQKKVLHPFGCPAQTAVVFGRRMSDRMPNNERTYAGDHEEYASCFLLYAKWYLRTIGACAKYKVVCKVVCKVVFAQNMLEECNYVTIYIYIYYIQTP